MQLHIRSVILVSTGVCLLSIKSCLKLHIIGSYHNNDQSLCPLEVDSLLCSISVPIKEDPFYASLHLFFNYWQYISELFTGRSQQEQVDSLLCSISVPIKEDPFYASLHLFFNYWQYISELFTGRSQQEQQRQVHVPSLPPCQCCE